MNIRIKGTRYEPTEELIMQVNEKVGGIARFVDESRSEAIASVELEKAVGGKNKGDIWRAELMIEHESGEFRAESTKTELDHALTTVIRDVARELSRAHAKRQKVARKGSAVVKSFLQGFGK